MYFWTILISLMMLISSCGNSTQKQEVMNNSLLSELKESFLNDSIVLPSKPSVELKDCQKNSDNESGEYKSSFIFIFQNFFDKSNYTVRGTAYFDNNGCVVKENGKKNIRINVISKDHKTVSSDELMTLRPKDTLGW